MIKLVNVSKQYKNKNRVVNALTGINISFENKGFHLIIGESGSGKTTLLNLISKSINPTEGNVVFSDSENSSIKDSSLFRAHNIGFIYQDYNLISDLTVLDNIKLALSLQKKSINVDKIIKQLNDLGLDNVIDSYPTQLSGGQQQRVCIARAFLLDHQIILADEPTGSLDDNNSIEILKLLKKIAKDKLVIVVSHNITEASKFADRIIVLANGQITSDRVINQTPKIDYTVNKNNNVTSKFLYYLGLKYLNFSALKTYLSIFIVTISLSLLFLSFSLMNFSEEKAYTKGVADENINYGIISKNIVCEYGYEKGYFQTDEIDLINDNFNTSILCYEFSNYICNNETDDRLYINLCSSVSNNDLNQLKIEINGNLPLDNQIVLTENTLSKLNISYSEAINKKVLLSGYEYEISGIINCDFFNDDEYLIILNENDSHKTKFINKIITDQSNYNLIDNTINDLNNINPKNIFIYDNIIYNSVLMATDLSTVFFEIGIIVSSIFITLSVLILMNMVGNKLSEKMKDILIIKKLGCDNKNLFKIFIVSSIILVLISLILSIIICFIAVNLINGYLKKEFLYLIDIFNINFLSIIIIIFIIMILLFLSTYIPLKKIKND